MLAWLGEWLQGIVVVVLLAIVVELVMPNSKMLRYSRLVVGLILLLTILNPVLQIFQVNFQDKLNASYSLWEKQAQAKGNSLPSLQQITEEAERLKLKREEAALDVTKVSLEQAIMNELKRASSASITDVAVELGRSEASNKQFLPYIRAVTVTMKSQKFEAEDKAVEAISPIEISDVSIPLIETNDNETVSSQPVTSSVHDQRNLTNNDEQWDELFRQHAQEIISIITSSWNVKRDHIFVQQAAND